MTKNNTVRVGLSEGQVQVASSALLTYSPAGDLLRSEHYQKSKERSVVTE